MQRVHCLHLQLLSKNTEGKSLDEIKALQIQKIKVPATFKELHQTLLFHLGINTILFGLRSALVIGVKSTTTAMQTKKYLQMARCHQRQPPNKVFVCHGNLHPTLAGGVQKNW
jgi:hypothetical protein